jgi:hypothetical protein
MRWFPADSVGMDKPVVKSLRFVDMASKTRAAEEYYVDKEHPFFVEVTWLVPITTVHLPKNYAYTQEVKDTITDYPLVKNTIKYAETVDSTRNIIDDESEICEFNIIYHHQNGDTTRTHKSIILHREITTIPEYTKTVTSFAYNWVRDEKLQIGSAAKAANHNEDNWTVKGRTDTHVALITNGSEPINTEYGYYHEAAHYKDEFVEIDFPFITPVMKEKKTWVESVEGDGYWDKARLFNTIYTEYHKWQQDAQETVLLQKEAKRVTSESWDKASCWQKILDNKVQWHFVFQIIYSDGETVNTIFDFEADRFLDVLTNWSSIEKSEQQSTNKVAAGEITSKVIELTQKGSTLNYTRETREYNSTATLVGSQQANQWRAVEPMSPEIEYKGQRFSFDRDNISYSNGATVAGGGEVDGYRVYKYGDVLTYTRANNVKTATAPGEIKVKAEEPETLISEKWDESSAKQTVYDDRIDRQIDRVWKYSTGREVRGTFKLSVSRLLQPISNWTSIEDNASQNTSSATASTTNSSQSKDVNGAKFAWVNVKRDISDRVKLNGSTQTNEWVAEDPLDCTVTYNGDTYTFPKLTVSMSNSASVGSAVKNGDYNEYSYTDKLSYSLGGNTKYSSAPGLIKVKTEEPETLVSEDWDSSSAKQTVTDSNVSWSLDWLERYSTGREVRKTFSWNDSRSLTPKSNWTSIETNTNQKTDVAVASVSKSAQSKDVSGAKFAWTRVTRDIFDKVKLSTSTQANEWDAVDPLDCSVTYKGKTYTFQKLTVSMSNSASVGSAVKKGDYEEYPYADKLSYSLGNNTKYSSAPGTIKILVAKPETLVSEGWDSSSAKQTVTDSNVSWSLDWLERYSTGREVRTTFSWNDSRSLTPKSNWSSVEKNANQNTGSATASTSSSAQSKDVNGAKFSWTRVTRDITSKAKLNASTQTNQWVAVDPMDCSVTYKEKTYTFSKLTVSMSNSASVGSAVKNGSYNEYSYADKLSYSLGNNTKYSSAPGTIKVKIEEPTPEPTPDPTFFPEEWGRMVKAKQTVANNERYNSYVYTWSLHFENGYVLPVVVRVDAANPEWNFAYVEKTSVTSYNGGTYNSDKGIWANTIAQDEPDQMVWAREGVMCANRNYSEAVKMHWDKDKVHAVTGKPSVTTKRFEFSISKGVFSVKDTYTGVTMGRWTYKY